MLLGLLLVIGGGLGVALWSSAQSERSAVLVAARSLEPGEVIVRTDLRIASIAADDDVASMPSSTIDALIGMTVRGPLAEGTIIGPSMLTDGALVPAGFALIGATLKVGRYPASGLRAGDRVVMIHTTTDGPLRLGEADVFAVQQRVDAVAGGEIVVSLLIPDGLVVDAAVGGAASAELSLVAVSS